jgi:DNA replication protein DnaC
MAIPNPKSNSCADCAGLGVIVDQVVGRSARARRCECQVRCKRCGGSGFVLVSAVDTSVAQPCACRHLAERIALFNAIGIPAAVAEASFETFKPYSDCQTQARAGTYDFARKFRGDEPNRGFLLHGKPGCGKTHLLAGTLRYLALEKGIGCRYIEFMLLLSDIKAGFNSGRAHMDILRSLAEVPVLAIDELGKERGTEWERSMLDELISRRYNMGLTTLFATNYPREATAVHTEPGRMVRTGSPEFQREAETMSLAQRVGDRIFSRLNEMCDFVRVEGPDFRKDAEAGRGTFWR